MPSSRAQKLEQNQRRLKEIATELEGITQAQALSTDPTKQRDLLEQLATLESEEKALKNSCVALQKELEEAAREKAATDKRIWLEQERPEAEKDRDAACAKVMAKIRNLKKEYDKLVEVEKRWTRKWNERDRPQGIDHDRPFISKAKRSIYQFLGMNLLPRSRQNDIQREVAKILGPTATIAAVLASEARRAAREEAKKAADLERLQEEEARKKELAVKEHQLEASPSDGKEVEEKQPTEQTADGTDR